MKPIEVNQNNEQSLFENVYRYYNDIDVKIIKPKFQIGNRISIPDLKKSFKNKYSNNWGREIFVVNKISDYNPTTYKLKDLNKEEIIISFYLFELERTAL